MTIHCIVYSHPTRLPPSNSLQEIGDENGDDSVSVSTYSQSKCNTNPNPGKPIVWLLIRTVTEESKYQIRCSKVSLDFRCHVAKQFGQIF